jgi:hypothetical protein
MSSNTVSEISPQIVIGGDVVRIRPTALLRTSPEPTSCRSNFVDEESEHILEPKCCGVLFDLHMKEKSALLPNGKPLGIMDVLILIEWNDSQRESKTRLVMMLPECVGENSAQSLGMMPAYRKGYNAKDIAIIVE